MKRQDWVLLHFAVLLLGMTGLFGKFLDMNPAAIIAGRSFFTVVFLAGCLYWLNVSWRAEGQNLARLVGSGVLLSLHWYAFFHSIQQSTVAVGVIGFSTYPVFVTFLEPLFFRENLRLKEVVSGVLVCVGLFFVAPDVNFDSSRFNALLWAVLSGALLALFTLLNRRLVRENHFAKITVYQHGIAFLCTLPFVIVNRRWPAPNEVFLLVILGILFTAVPQALLVRGLNQIKAQLASVLVGLEPVYSILFAMVLLGEYPSLSTLAGGLVVGLSVALASHSPAGLADTGGKSTHADGYQAGD